MNKPDLQPAGFQPQLLEYLTAIEVVEVSGRINRQRALGTESLADKIKRVGKNELERDRMTRAVAAVMQIGNLGLTIAQIEGVHVWSTTDPNSEQIEPVIKASLTTTRKSVSFRPISAGDRIGLVTLFRESTEDLPDLTRVWFGLPHTYQEILDLPAEQGQQVAAEFFARTRLGDTPQNYNPLDFKNLQGDIRDFVNGLRTYANKPERDSALLAIQTINRRIVEGEDRFNSEDMNTVHFGDIEQEQVLKDI